MFANLSRHVLFALLFGASTLFSLTATAEVVRTYEFVGGDDTLLRFGGGLISGNSVATPTGTFEVTIDDNGAATLTDFDVMLEDVVIETEGASVFIEGESLAGWFFGVDPIGLAIEEYPGNSTSTPKDFFGESSAGNEVHMKLSSLVDNETTAYITAYPASFLDNPSLSTRGSGFAVKVIAIPEPSSLVLLAGGLSVVFWRRRRS